MLNIVASFSGKRSAPSSYNVIMNSYYGLIVLTSQVDYDNHPLFKAGPNAKKKGSPVRIFTNLDPAKIELPASEGYRSALHIFIIVVYILK